MSLKVLTSSQIKEGDAYTIKNEPVSSLDLMERAANKCTDWISHRFEKEGNRFIICSGPGNNGGDGLCIARMLYTKGFNVEVFLFKGSGKLSTDCEENYKKLSENKGISVKTILSSIDFPRFEKTDIVIDAIYGTGLGRPLEGIAVSLVKHINNANLVVISIDMPSGLMVQYSSENLPSADAAIVEATYTLTFQFPKDSFMHSETGEYAGLWHVLTIGIHPDYIQKTKTQKYYIVRDDISINERLNFTHKGTYGHGLLVSGRFGMMGAAVLASRAAMRSGIGLLTTHIPGYGYEIMQISVPEAIVDMDSSDVKFTKCHVEGEEYDAIAVGPGIGADLRTRLALRQLLKRLATPVLLDADALNILARHPKWIALIPKNSILTPHPKEFDRLAGESENSYQRIEKAIAFAKENSVYIVLKGYRTAIVCPDGNCYFNSTGNPGMATAGSGDVLTGIILSLMAQKYTSKEAAISGVYIHGLAGNIAAQAVGEESLLASDIADSISKAFLHLHKLA